MKRPALTVDVVIEYKNLQQEPEIILIKRRNPPLGWALPGGFVDYGETVENAAIREAKEETNLDVKLKRLLGIYSDPNRDPRGHTVSIVFVAEGTGKPVARDDAIEIGLFRRNSLPDLAFDHFQILRDYFKTRSNQRAEM